MVDWHDLEAAVDAAVHGEFAELVRHSPIKNGVADPARPLADIRGILHQPSPVGTVSLGGNFITTLSASESALVVNRAEYPDRVFAARDKIRGLEMPGQPWFEIKTVDNYHSITVLTLNRA